MLCLDNDVLRKFRKTDPDPAVVDYLADRASQPWCLPAIVAFEYLQYYDSTTEVHRQCRELEELFDEIVVLDVDVAVEATNIQNLLASTDTSLDLADLLVAATARVSGATLATANKSDFDKAPVHDLLDVEIVETV